MHANASANVVRLLAALILAAAFSFAWSQHAHAAGALGTYQETLLSNERDTSRWAFVTRRVSAWSEPGERGIKQRRLSTRTPDRTSELVLTLRERAYEDGTVWTEVRLPMRGSDARGWVSRKALGKYRAIHSRIEIDRAAGAIRLFKRDKLVWSAAVGTGGEATPTGSFYVRNRLDSENPRGRFGPSALGLSAAVLKGSDWPGGRTVGIHGTNKPRNVPGVSSDPCIRLRNHQMKSLFALTPPGTPVAIR